MTNEEKQLLLQDLCSRLPYMPQVVYNGITETLSTLHIFDMTHIKEEYVDIKPYLRPMSSMTEEEWKEFDWFVKQESDELIRFRNTLKFYGQHHIDYNGLIPMGLALEAPEGMYEEGGKL